MRRLDDGGGAELFVLVSVMAMLVALGLVVDGGGYMRAKDDAVWCAQQAARAAAERIDLEQVQETGSTPVLVGSVADATAQQVAGGAGMAGVSALNADGSVTVTCSTEYAPVVLAVAGARSWTVTEQATARPARGINQEG
ncbi:MAG: pilus assembly protein TadG-related protein [Micrococcales bacterium]|nr:pilus assembly protein TadG-related protein [Micrococcales bacterium]MCL2668309.1 pilus assembly protein TadG-related protein [Micrococcales bacterium]